MDESTEFLKRELQNKIALGEQLLSKTCSFNHVDGIGKLQKKIRQEINFLSKIFHKTIKKEHLMCTNLHHFSALIAYVETHSEDCNAVMQHFPVSSSNINGNTIPSFGSTLDDGISRISVDVVLKQRRSWVKVIARNPKALSQLSTGAGKYGQKTVLDQAQQFVLCARQHPVLYEPPQVIFAFSNGIEVTLANLLESRGVQVEGQRIPDSSPHQWEEEEEEEEEQVEHAEPSHSQRGEEAVEQLNLDVSTMVAYVSALTNGRSHFIFQQPLLTQQAEWERARPVKPVLDQLFQGKHLVCCESAYQDFKTIVDTMGGPGERERTETLMTRVSVVPDQCPPRVAALNLSGSIKPRSVLVFGTGDALKALTISANEGFVRGSKNQGVEFAVFVHESRALSEVKEQQAMPIS